MPPVSVLIKPASGMCNMSCDYCFYCDETSKRSQASYGFMSEATLKNVIRKTILNAQGAAHYMFQGGEPTLIGIPFFQKALYYQQHYNKKGIAVYNAIQTNGTLLNEDWCRFLSENKFLVGLSVDGTQEIHDGLRHTASGGSTFHMAVRAARLMDQFHVEYNILTVVTPMIASQVDEVYSFYQKQGWRYQQYIPCLDPLGEAHGQTPHALPPRLYGRFLIDLFSLWYRDVQKGRAPYNRQFENYISIAAGYYPASCDQCGVCSIQNVVEANGNVYPCDFYMLDEYLLGNFNENNFSQINQKRSEIGFVERSYLLSARCRDCKYHWICKGGCQRNRDYNPDSNTYENYYCESYRMFFDSCLEKIQELAKDR
ncbi:MAG: anaerobic sulfatase maturase [Lachnospiraceae bacterium]|nr:anaerobic sulfatase maturase [Lachnospiraceae bacterium]